MEVLFIDLGTDLVPALGLGAELPNESVMDQKPRSKDSHLIDRKLLGRAGIYGLTTSAFGDGSLLPLQSLRKPVPLAFPIRFSAKRIIPSCGCPPRPSSSPPSSSARSAWDSIADRQGIRLQARAVRKQDAGHRPDIEVVLVLAVTSIPWLNSAVFQAQAITSWQTWLIILTFPFIVFFLDEARKKWLRDKESRSLIRKEEAQ